MNLPVVDSTGTLLFALHIFYSKQILPAANVLFVLQVQMLNLICPNFRWTHQTYWESPWITGLSWQQYLFRWTQAEVSVSPKISGLKPTMMKSTRAVLIRRKKWHNEHHFSDLPPPSLYSMINSIIDLSVTWLYQVKNKHLLLCMASRLPYTYFLVWLVYMSYWIVTKFLAKVLGIWFWSMNFQGSVDHGF